MQKLFRILIIFIIPFSVLFGQDYPKKEIDFDNFIQELFPAQNEDLPFEELYENLLQFYQTPLDINKATRDQLASLYILSENQINSILKYRDEQGKTLSIYELQVIPELDLNTIYKLIPFMKVENSITVKDLRKDLMQSADKYFLMRYERTLEKKHGQEAEEKAFQGSADKVYGRLRVSHTNKYSVGLTFEKDHSESLKWSPAKQKYGFDYFSYHLLLKKVKNFKSIAIGDYQVQFGQGLLSGAGFSAGKGGETISTLRRYNLGIRPYSPSVENGFFRGTAFTYSLKKFDLSAFYSNINEDASIKIDSSHEGNTGSIQITGLHRTNGELSARKKFNHLAYGGDITYNHNNTFNLGFTFVNTDFKTAIQEKPDKYNQFDFRGKNNFAYSLNYSYILQNFNFFGEFAQCKSKGTGIVTGALASFSSRADFAVVYRNYTRDFHSFYGNAFGENSKNSNEEGIYFGLKITPIKKLVFSTYFDRYYKPWLSYQATAPSHGYEYLGRLTFIPGKTVNLYMQYRGENREVNEKGDSKLAAIKEERIRSLLFNVDFAPFKSLRIKSRFQASKTAQGSYSSIGMLIYTDIVLDLGKVKLSGRYALFDTDDHSSRIYAYEKDVLYTYSFPAMHGQGIRNYLIMEYSVNRNLDFWLRLARTTYNSVDHIGSGLDMINGNKRTDLKFQIKYKF